MEWIKNIVSGLIETYETRDVNELIIALGIKIIKKELTGNKKARFTRDIFGNEYIYIDNNLDEYEERVILAHELGHAILHTHITNEVFYSSYVSKDKIEFQANYFAAELLIDLNNIENNILEEMTYEQLSKYFYVPEPLIEYKLKYIC